MGTKKQASFKAFQVLDAFLVQLWHKNRRKREKKKEKYLPPFKDDFVYIMKTDKQIYFEREKKSVTKKICFDKNLSFSTFAFERREEKKGVHLEKSISGVWRQNWRGR